jgi:hypothetical protein
MERFRQHERTSRPMGYMDFIEKNREGQLPRSATEKTGTEKERYQ